MSSDDDKDILAGLGDLDWDAALDDWEKKTFVPEVARDAETNKVAAPLENEGQEPGQKPTTAPGAPTNPPTLGEVSAHSTVIAPVPSE